MIDGEVTLEEAIALDAQRNAQFARRQRTWFRRELALEVLDAAEDPEPAAIERVDPFIDRLAHEPPAGILSSP